MKRYLTMTLALALTVGSVQAAYSADVSWQSGWTGKEVSNSFTVTAEGDTVTMTNDKVNNGKFTDDEDSIIYYAAAAAADSDFELKATVSLDDISTDEESSNPNQSSVGLGVLDDLYNKTDEVSYTNSVFVGTWAEKKTDDIAFYPIYRENSAEKTEGEALSDTFANSGEDLGTYELSIKKIGNAYTLTCGENSETIELKDMSGDIYPCLYIARNVSATFTDVQLTVDDRKAVSLAVDGEYKKDYFYGDELDLEGLKAVVTYDDGSTEEVNDYLVKGYSPTKTGTQTVRLERGTVSASIEVNVSDRECTDLTVEYPPLRTEYYSGMPFRSEGIEVKAAFSDGTERTLEDGEYTLTLDGKELKDGDIITLDGKANVKVSYNAPEGYSEGGAYDTFTLEGKNEPLTAIEVEQPEKTHYYVGDEFEADKLTVYALYGSDRVLLKQGEYEVSGFDSSKAGSLELSVSLKGNDSVSAPLNIEVSERQPVSLELIRYPRTTYDIGESFDGTQLEVGIVYDNGDVEVAEEGTDYSVSVPAGAYASAGEYEITIVPSNGELAPLTLKTVAEQNESNVWRKTVFGQSSGYDKQEDGITGVTAENYGTVEGTINVRSWEGSGKITNDHDGISYYYTTVEADKDFELYATVKVNRYLEHDNDDTRRNGQEAFGIMLRDVIPLKAPDGSKTVDETAAVLDEEGIPVPDEDSMVFASNMMIIGGYSGTGWPNDPTAETYEKNTNINRINMLVREGVEATDGGGTRIGPYALNSQFPAEGNSYDLYVRRVNGGIYASCYDPQTGETMERYYYDDSFLTVQDTDLIYVGFFTARWADIDVSNVSFHETEKAYDQTVTSTEETAVTPELDVTAPKYSLDTDYKLTVASPNSSGRVSVRLNDTLIAEDIPLEEAGAELSASLRANTENKLTVIYTPDNSLALTSYEPVIYRQSIFCKDVDTTAQTVYVSPEGSFEGDGTEASPYDIDTAVGFAQPGQTIILKEGVYYRTTPIEIELGNDGTAEAPKTLMTEEGKSVAIDLMNVSDGVIHTGNYWHIKGIEFRNSGDNLKCYHLGGSNNIIEDCSFHDNGDMGLQISRTYSTDDRSLWPSNNLILNCESYNNCDPSMINADGFGCKLTSGEGNVFRGCKSHHNLDDGWDLYTKVNTGAIGAVTLEDCVSYKNGYRLNEDGTETPYGKGGNNGFKLGGENVGVKHRLINCEAYCNANNGVTTNSNPFLYLENVVCHDNEGSNFSIYSDKPEEFSYDINGVVSYNGGLDDVVATINEDTEYTNASDLPILSDINYFTFNGVSANASGEAAPQE